MQYQYQRSEGWFVSERFMNLLSIEVRNRAKYHLPTFTEKDGEWVSENVEEVKVWSINTYFGYKFNPYKGSNSLGLYVHYYNGINPFGQFRNYPSTGFWGFSLIYEV